LCVPQGRTEAYVESGRFTDGARGAVGVGDSRCARQMPTDDGSSYLVASVVIGNRLRNRFDPIVMRGVLLVIMFLVPPQQRGSTQRTKETGGS
jgi:hypothetical protein